MGGCCARYSCARLRRLMFGADMGGADMLGTDGGVVVLHFFQKSVIYLQFTKKKPLICTT